MTAPVGRTVDHCPHRQPLDAHLGQANHYCALAQSICGASDVRLFAVRPDECALCCRMKEPRFNELNGLVSSTLYKALCHVVQSDGMEGCSSERARSLIPFAKRHFSVICFDRAPMRPSTGPCRHLGPQTGSRLCKSCRGQVWQKVFVCHHPSHESTTIRECQTCAEYQPATPAA